MSPYDDPSYDDYGDDEPGGGCLLILLAAIFVLGTYLLTR